MKTNWTIEALGQPSRNFNLLAAVTLRDPLDGREKFMVANFTSGGVGILIFIDPILHTAEEIPLPGDEGAWALLPCGGKLIVGTSPNYGYILSLDLKTRKWAAPLRVEGETYIWSMARGSDGRVYAGTYGTSALLRYDPVAHSLVNLGRVSPNPENFYCRQIEGGLPGYILIAGGHDSAFLIAWHIQSGEKTMIAEAAGDETFLIRGIFDGCIYVEKSEKMHYYDARTFREVLPPEGCRERAFDEWLTCRLENGARVGIRGQEYFTADKDGTNVRYHLIPLAPPATSIRTLAVDDTGKVWGACAFGQTIFSYDPKDGANWNSRTVCEKPGEVYGMVFIDDLLYLTAYVGGDHIVYDPAKPWDQRGNVNPRTLHSVGPDLIRPVAESIIGPDGAIWTGWSAKYGAYGGGLSRIDPVSREITAWLHPVKDQQVMGITSDDQFLYFTTNGGANGLPVKNDPGHFCIWSPQGDMVAKFPLGRGGAVGRLQSVGNVVLVVETEEKCLLVFDKQKRAFVKKIDIGAVCSRLIHYDAQSTLASCEGKLLRIDSVTQEIVEEIELPGNTMSLAMASENLLYTAVGKTLYRLIKPRADSA